ncbi:MAG TPA: hypothetical protein VLJ42_01105 [Solirubrobacteraceae bacterium]|nr:hypothetical protein [Solirubrobacteraceae bacterium]
MAFSQEDGGLSIFASRYTRIRSHAQAAALVGELLDPNRAYIVVGLTSRPGEEVPSLHPDEVMTLLPSSARVYFIPSGTLTCRMSERMPKRTAPYNGAARVWMPGLSADSNHFDHPQIYDRSGEYGPRALRVLAYELRDALEAQGIDFELDPVTAFYELEIAQIHEELEIARRDGKQKLQDAVNLAEHERNAAIERAERAERRLWVTERELALLRPSHGSQPLQTPPHAPNSGASADAQPVEASQNGV